MQVRKDDYADLPGSRFRSGNAFAADVYQIISQEVRRLKQEKSAWVYCRIDAPEDNHGTLKAQRKLLMDYTDQIGFAMVGYSEDLGFGRDFERPGWKRFIKAAQKGNIDVLVVRDISRIGGDTCRIMEYLEKLRQSGIDVYSPMEGKLNFSLQRFIGMCMEDSEICH